MRGMNQSRILSSITKRGDRWRLRYRDPITKKWVAAGAFQTKGEAIAARDELLEQSDSLVGRDKAKVTFGEYATAMFWPAETLADKTRSQQLRLYRSYVEPRWGAVRLTDITIEDIEAWLARPPGPTDPPATVPLLRATPRIDGRGMLGHSSYRQAYWIFHKIIAKAVERGYIGKSPLPRKSGIGKIPPTKPGRALEPAEVALLSDAARRYETLIYVLAYGGFRIGELFALRYDDLDFQHNEISVDESVIEIPEERILRIDGTLKRPRSHRSVPMPQAVMDMLAALPPGNRSDLIWANRDGNVMSPANWRRRVFAPAVATAGLAHMTPHDLRHTAASAWFDEGFDIVEVARFLGDSLAVAEQTYTHLFRGRRSERMDKMNDRITRGRAEAADRQAKTLPAGVIPLRRKRAAG